MLAKYSLKAFAMDCVIYFRVIPQYFGGQVHVTWFKSYYLFNSFPDILDIFTVVGEIIIVIKYFANLYQQHCHGQGKTLCFFSRSGKSQGILHQVREILNPR